MKAPPPSKEKEAKDNSVVDLTESEDIEVKEKAKGLIRMRSELRHGSEQAIVLLEQRCV